MARQGGAIWPGGCVKQQITGQNILATGGLML